MGSLETKEWREMGNNCEHGGRARNAIQIFIFFTMKGFMCTL